MKYIVVLVATACLGLLAGWGVSPKRECKASLVLQTRRYKASEPLPMPGKDSDLHTMEILSKANVETLTIVLMQWKRHTLPAQLAALAMQTLKADEVIVLQNEAHLDLTDMFEAHPQVKYIHSTNWNTGGMGRFTIPLFLNTTFIAILDDDCIPEPAWLDNCLRLCKERNAIVGGQGLIMTDVGRPPWSVKAPRPDDVEVDVAYQSWFFRREWIYHFWMEEPASLQASEDIHFAASGQLFGKVPVMVPRMPQSNASLWGHSPSSPVKGRHVQASDPALAQWRARGWKPLAERSPEAVKQLQRAGLLERAG